MCHLLPLDHCALSWPLSDDVGAYTLLLFEEGMHSGGLVVYLLSTAARCLSGHVVVDDVQTCSKAITFPGLP